MKLILKISAFYLMISTATISIADVGKVTNKLYSSVESFLDNSFENTDFSIRKIESVKPQISVMTLKPVSGNENNSLFFQGSFFMHDSDRETINLGLVKRFLNDDESTLLGFNAFYDYELDYDHQRFSLGTDIKSKILDLSYNQYFSNSGSKTGKNNKQEEAVDGHDLELGAHLPIPSMKVYAKLFDFNVNGGNDFEGSEYSVEIKFRSGLTFEVGHTDFDSHTDQTFFLILNIVLIQNTNEKFITSEAFKKVSMKSRMYEKLEGIT